MMDMGRVPNQNRAQAGFSFLGICATLRIDVVPLGAMTRINEKTSEETILERVI
jgi:hypothetical protein